jgi:hypothetical protein
MTADGLNAAAVAEMVLPMDGPYQPDQVIEAARTVGELVRRLNFATRHASALRYPPQVDRTMRALCSALYGLDQTFTQIATRLGALAADPRVEDDHGDPWAASTEAADHLRHAAAELGVVTRLLDRATAITNHLGYDTSTVRPRGQTFPPPDTSATVHEGQSSASAVTPPQRSVSTSLNPAEGQTHDRHR